MSLGVMGSLILASNIAKEETVHAFQAGVYMRTHGYVPMLLFCLLFLS